MKKIKGKLKIFTCLLSLMMIGTLLPTAAFAEGEEDAGIKMESGAANLKVNESKVAFAGHEWWVIGVDASGDDTNGNGRGVDVYKRQVLIIISHIVRLVVNYCLK